MGWTPSRVVELEGLLPADALRTSPDVAVAEGNGDVFVGTDYGSFAIVLKRNSPRKVGDVSGSYEVFPYVCFIMPGTAQCFAFFLICLLSEFV